jgi:hypothetical protein
MVVPSTQGENCMIPSVCVCVCVSVYVGEHWNSTGQGGPRQGRPHSHIRDMGEGHFLKGTLSLD